MAHETLKSTITLIDYHAPWCGPCRAMEPIMKELMDEYGSKINFEDINIDEQPDTAQARGVMSIPAFHIMKDDKIIDTFVGYQSKEEMVKHLKGALV